MRPRYPLHLVAAILLITGVVAGCGDDDTDVDTPQADHEANGSDDQDDGVDENGDSPRLGAADASIVVDGTTHELSEVRRCEPPETGSGETQITEAIHGLSADDGTLVLVLQVTETPVSETHWVSWRGPEGLFDTFVIGGGTGEWIGDGEIVYDGPIINLDGRRAAGSAILADSQTLDPDDRVEITFDIAVPADFSSC